MAFKWTAGGDKWKDLSLSGKLGRVAQMGTGLGMVETAVGNQFKHPVRPVKKSKEMLASDLSRLENDPASLGLTDAERRQMLSEASEASNTQRQAQSSELSRDALAATDQGRGQFIEAQQAVAAGVGADQATASVEANKLSQAMIEKEKDRILGNLDAARERARQNAQFWAGFGLDSAEAAASVIPGIGG